MRLATQLIGSWTLISNTNMRPDGSKVDGYGPHPNGSLMLDSNGRFADVALRSDLPKLASSNRTSGTAEENRAIVSGSVAAFGTYSVNEADQTITLHVEGSTFPNWTGSDQKRPFTLTGNQQKWNVPAASMGGASEVVWKRVE
jgi:lipocalin-like protein